MDPKAYFTNEKLEDWQHENMKLLRMAAIDFLYAVRDCVPPCADQKECIRKVREAVYLGNAAISLRGDP